MSTLTKVSQEILPGVRLVRKRGNYLAIAKVTISELEQQVTGMPAEYFRLMVKDCGIWVPADQGCYADLEAAARAIDR